MIKFCKDCVHYHEPTVSTLAVCNCHMVHVQDSEPDLVTGNRMNRTFGEYVSCANERKCKFITLESGHPQANFFGLIRACGPGGRFFKEREDK